MIYSFIHSCVFSSISIPNCVRDNHRDEDRVGNDDTDTMESVRDNDSGPDSRDHSNLHPTSLKLTRRWMSSSLLVVLAAIDVRAYLNCNMVVIS
ncbi:unnamed protein product [Thelazia callipaeda]|uniref:Secreted protein n=1 Tax=Thelazia callipaeda TaxID=103827 RepID=A0A0N5DC99_THECL|nr:unnamed protein product [Thelazia callipaeda]